MTAEEYDIKRLTCHVDFGASPIEGAPVQVRGGTGFNWAVKLFTNSAGDTPQFMAAAGEVLDTELFRYGFDKYRTTKQVVMDADKVVKYGSLPAKSSDSLEPNDLVTSPAPITLPASIQATLAREGDSADCYYFSLTDGRPLRVDLAVISGSGAGIELYDTAGNGFQGANGAFFPELPGLVFTPHGPGDYILKVLTTGTDTRYTLSLSSVNYFNIAGTVGPGTQYGRVHCVESDRTLPAEFANGHFDLGYFAPGTYVIEAAAPQQTPAPASRSITITNADVTADFSLTAAPGDLGEPNNTLAQAWPITPDGIRKGGYCIGVGPDGADWYSFSATAGQAVEVKIDWGQPWFGDPAISTVQDPLGNNMGSALSQGQGSQLVDFVAPLSGTYAFKVEYSEVDYGITVTLSP